jgi:hypothetical protein
MYYVLLFISEEIVLSLSYPQHYGYPHGAGNSRPSLLSTSDNGVYVNQAGLDRAGLTLMPINGG